MSIIQLPVPKIINPNNANDFNYHPNVGLITTEAMKWKEQHHIPLAMKDALRICLLIIDGQKDFCFPPPSGSLYVGGRSLTGAMDDNRRLVEFAYKYLAIITRILATLDTHFPFQIFFNEFWQTIMGNHPNEFTQVTVDMVTGNRPELRPNPVAAQLFCEGKLAWLEGYVRHYTEQLKAKEKDPLTLWTKHCMRGTPGHAMVGVLYELMAFHAYARSVRLDSAFEVKGTHPLTEYYSPFSPEVTTRHDGKPLLEANYGFLDTVMEHDVTIIGGQAADKCVKAGIYDMLHRFKNNPEILKKIYILRDCMSAVTVPNPAGGFFVDGTADAEKAFAEFSAAGMHVVESTTPMEEWPDFPKAA